MENHAQETLKNATYNSVGYFWPILLTIFITPFVIHHLGVRDYGIYIFINTIISLISLLDLGLSTAVVKRITEAYSKGDSQKLKRLVYSINSLFLIIGILGLILLASSRYWGPLFFPSEFGAYKNIATLLFLAGLLFLMGCLNSTFAAIPTSLQRFDIINKIGFVSLNFSSLGMFLLVWSGHGLISIFLLQLFTSAAVTIVNIKVGEKLVPAIKYSFAWDKKEIIETYNFALKVFLSNIANSLLTYLDRLIIPIFLGPSQLTYYSMPGNISSKIPGVSNMLSGVIFPAAVKFNSLDNKEKLKSLYRRSFRLLLILSSAICFSIIFLSDPIMRQWLGKDFAENSTGVLVILALTNLFLAMSGPLSNFLIALGRIKLLVITNIIIAILNAIFLLVLLPRFGIMGAAWAYLLSVVPIIYMFYYTEKYLLEISESDWYHLKLLAKLSLVTFLSLLIDKLVIAKLITSLPTLIILGPISVLIYLSLYKLFNFFENDDWADLQKFFFKILGRLSLTIRKTRGQKKKK